nr:hypothetical protein [Saccharolobus solfataricus]
MVAYLFSGLGVFYNNQTLINLGSFFTTTLGSVIIGIIILIIGAIIASIGKYGWSFVFITGIVSILSTIVTSWL